MLDTPMEELVSNLLSVSATIGIALMKFEETWRNLLLRVTPTMKELGNEWF